MKTRHSAALATLGLVLISTGCLHRHRPAQPTARPYPPPVPPTGGGRAPVPAAPIVQGEHGLASWYGHPYHGRPTASGEIYNMYDYTAAHRTLPFGTRVRVHNLENSRAVDVRINDRGPFVEGRIIDLSFTAAQTIGMPGIARVQLEILGFGPQGEASAPPGIFAVQVGAFREVTNAERLKAHIAERYRPVSIESYDRGDGVFHRVRVGRLTSEEAANRLARELREGGYATATFVVRVN